MLFSLMMKRTVIIWKKETMIDNVMRTLSGSDEWLLLVHTLMPRETNSAL